MRLMSQMSHDKYHLRKACRERMGKKKGCKLVTLSIKRVRMSQKLSCKSFLIKGRCCTKEGARQSGGKSGSIGILLGKKPRITDNRIAQFLTQMFSKFLWGV